MSLISPENHLGLLSVLFSCVALAFWLERFRWAKRLSATLLVIAVPLALSNTGVIPRTAPAYDFVSTWFVTVAIPLLLFKADVKRILAETGPTLAAFLIAVVGTTVGVLVAFYLIPIGPDAAAVAAVHTGGYIGGSLNFVAVAQVIGFDDPTRFSAVLGAETTAGLAYLMVLSIVPGTRWFRRWEAATVEESREPRRAAEPTIPVAGDDDRAPPTGSAALMEMSAIVGLSLAVCAAGSWLAERAGLAQYALLFITVLSVVAANVWRRRLAAVRGDTELGMLLMFVFFAVFGAGTDVLGLLRNAPLVLLFSATIVTVHAAIVFGIGRLVGLDPREITIGSNACLLGPPTAAAEAVRNGWDDLATPGLLLGILGYVIGNFAGVTLYTLVQ